ncbi:trypsin-like serine peptidase [Kitasatospora sp. NPDC088391]|uniref:trypsin-like serine peptidase n=1 Tax=Kitasatospora sp. NPDC088391 TaxID=3364074 RepID=UPI0037FFCF25
MGRHTRPRENRAPRRRPLALTAVLAAGVVAATTAVGLYSGQLAGAAHHPSTDSVAMAGDLRPASPSQSPSAAASASASPAATPTPGDPAAPDVRQAVDPTADTARSTPSSAPPAGPLGVTSVAADTAESRRVGALFSGAVGPGNHFCTASVIDSPGRNLILTAAHCLSGASGVTFVPGYRDGQAPYGSWKVTKVYTSDGWQNDGDPDEDFAILAVAPGSDGRQIEDVLGGNPIGTDAGWTARSRLYGYPAGSEQPITCTNDTSRQDTYQRRIDCPSFPGGTSGGPFLEVSTGEVIGVIGGYQQGGDTDDTSYSAAFDHTVGDLLAKAG